MGYRNDLDAAHARVDALERALAEARAELATRAETTEELDARARRELLERAKLREELDRARLEVAEAREDAARAQGTTALVRRPAAAVAVATLSPERQRVHAAVGTCMMSIVAAIALNSVPFHPILASLGLIGVAANVIWYRSLRPPAAKREA